MLFTKAGASALLTKNSEFELKADAIKDDGTFEGYGSVFGNVDSYGEIVEPGAFTASLVETKRKGSSIKLLWQHDPTQPLGVWEDLAEDNKGLWGRGKLLIEESPKAREAHGLLKHKALDGLSIGYRVTEAKPDEKRPGILRLLKLDLREISVVTFQANDRARVDDVKHGLAAGVVPTVREFEGLLRDAGFSKSLAAAIAAKATPHLRGDPEQGASEIDRFFNRLGNLFPS